ncbi:Kinesin-like protein KIF6 [Hypsibius exemplaris]|uniref:Kinesin-like protein n=1 Tax=Hypsibius exemplaris TaxID=2072580 RepID=A0A1W0X0H0_HYPEX|nr:Kinesin-like protein KIF6 [Hypsibius exemplaris]
MKETIRIYVRLKPLEGRKSSCHYETFQESENPLNDNAQTHIFQLSIPKEAADGHVNNSRELFRFHFDGVLESGISQTDVFEIVAKPIVERVLDGYNGTLFAYGQTGSGKTFTITGHGVQEKVATTKGIIPRTLAYIFAQINKSAITNNEGESSASISYFEIYNESAYDLLQTRDPFDKLEDLTKIQLLEDADQNIHLRNLSVHRARSESEAMAILAIGEANRVMAETPINQTSTRSHCIFTIIITRRDSESSSIMRTSKLHIVDLAGSERVYKSGIVGRSLNEAKSINLALHHLEQVIIALADKNRSHIPYRNSMMTSILKDSLGGNSLTSMIATCSLDEANLGETISTCRFAQRVALIRNEVVRNETVDPLMEIELLKKQIQQLKNTCFLLHGGVELSTDPLTDEELLKCQENVSTFLAADDSSADMLVGLDWRKIQQCFRLLKQKMSGREVRAADVQNEREDCDGKSQEDVEKLRKTLQQRDREMAILCKLLRQEKRRIDDLMSHSGYGSMPDTTVTPRPSAFPLPQVVNSTVSPSPASPHMFSDPSSLLPAMDFTPPSEYLPWLTKLSQLTNAQMSDLRRALLTKFIDGHAQRNRAECLKQNLTERVNKARQLGTSIRTAQAEQQCGTEQLSALQECGDPRAENFSREVEYGRIRLQGMLEQLGSLKEQVEYFEKLTREVTNVMQTQFDQWWTLQTSINSS